MCCWRGLCHCTVQWTDCVLATLLCGNSFTWVEDLIDSKYTLNITAEMNRQLCISMQCLCASSQDNLAANTCAFYLVNYTAPKEEYCELWYVKVSEKERKTKHT